MKKNSSLNSNLAFMYIRQEFKFNFQTKPQMKLCLKQKLKISKFWTTFVFINFSFEAMKMEKKWVYKMKVWIIYKTAITSIFLSAHAVRRRLAAGVATGCPSAAPRPKPPSPPPVSLQTAPSWRRAQLPRAPQPLRATRSRTPSPLSTFVSTRRRATALAAAQAVLIGSRRQTRVRLFLSSH